MVMVTCFVSRTCAVVQRPLVRTRLTDTDMTATSWSSTTSRSRWLWLVNQSKCFAGQWLVNQPQIPHPNKVVDWVKYSWSGSSCRRPWATPWRTSTWASRCTSWRCCQWFTGGSAGWASPRPGTRSVVCMGQRGISDFVQLCTDTDSRVDKYICCIGPKFKKALSIKTCPKLEPDHHHKINTP